MQRTQRLTVLLAVFLTMIAAISGVSAQNDTAPLILVAVPGDPGDQLVGQLISHVCGLGYLTEKTHVQKTLQSIMKYNYKSSMHDHFNNMR